MTCEFLSGLTQLSFPSSSIVVGAGNITTAGTLYFFLTARNRAGWTIASSPVPINYPANSSITITLPPAARGLGTDFLRYSLSANTNNDPIASIQLAEWENYEADQYTRRTLTPVVLSRNEHINPASSVAIPADLPTGADLINGQHRLIVGGLPSNAPSSYYKYSQYENRPASGADIIANSSQKWVRVSNPYTGQILDPYGTGGCAADVRNIASNYIIPPPAYDPVHPDPVKGGTPIKLIWHNNAAIALKSGTNFGLEIRQGNQNRTDAFNGKLILTLKGYTNGTGGLDRLAADGVNFLPFVDVDRVWGYADDALGILTLDKDLPPGASVVYEIAPYFTAQQFQGNLAANELISTYLYPYTQSGKNVGALWAITGDLVLPTQNRHHVIPKLGATVEIGSGSAIVKGYTYTQKPAQQVSGLTPNTANQKITLDGNGIASLRSIPLGSEIILAIVSTQSGSSKIGTLSTSIAITSAVNLTVTYPYAGAGDGTIRSDYPTIGEDIAEFNPNYVRIFAKSGTTVYPALSNGASQIAIVPDFTQAIAIDSLGAAIPQPTNPTDPLFGLFDPPTITGIPATGGTIPAGSYQFFAVYYYDGTTVSAIDSVAPLSQLTFADLSRLNQGWGRPIYNLSDLRSIDRNDTFAWQQRPVAGGSIFYYDPDSLAVDNDITIFKPSYLAANIPGRWLIRKSTSITPAGIWNNTSTYSYLNQVVVPNDGSYLYINPASSSGNPLTDTNYWQQTSFRGAAGVAGVSGSPHVARGTYSGGATYKKYDEVNSSGSSYWWSNNTAGNTAPPSSDWQLIASKGDTGAAGSGGGTTTASGITDFAEAVDDRVAQLLAPGANITLTYNDAGNILTIASTASGGLSPWQTKTSNYTAVSGDRLRVDCTAGNITLLMPANPTTTFEAEIQRIDTSANSLIIDPNGKNLKNQANKDGLFNNGNIGLSEHITYPNSTIGYLPQHDRLTYQTHVASGSDPLFANVVLLTPMNATAGITDIKGKTTTNNGVTVSTAILDPFGQNAGVIYFPGSGSNITVAQSSDFAFAAGAATIDLWLYPTAFPSPSGGVWGLMDARPTPVGTDWTINGNSTGNPTFYDTVQGDVAGGSLVLNQWNYLCVSRSAVASEPHKIWINGTLVLTASNRNNSITANGNLTIGDILNTAPPNDGSFTGYLGGVRITRAYRDGSIVPTAPFPTS